MDEENLLVRRHLLIAGTGRAGTSFLVRYLAELGLDTHLGRCGDNPAWDEHANAGLEDAPVLGTDSNLPYVIKSPWLYEFIDELLADVTFVPDAVIIPVRDLAEAAVSRSILERRAIHEKAHWMSELERSWEDWGTIPGGIVYSLNPIDQGRLLAVGFHHIVQRLVAADIPIVFLAFPKLIEDPTYLYNRLRPVLPQAIDHATACAAHRRLADRDKVRVGAEIEAAGSDRKSAPARIMRYESHTTLDAIALRRELGRTRKQYAAESAAAAVEADRLRERLATVEAALAEAAAAIEQARRMREESEGGLRAQVEQGSQQAEELKRELARLRRQVGSETRRREDTEAERRELEAQGHALKAELANIRASRSWRLTSPYRAAGGAIMDLFRNTR